MGVTVCQMSHSPDPFACLGRSHAINASRSKRSSGHIGNFRATDVHVLSLIFQFEGVGGFNALDPLYRLVLRGPCLGLATV